MCYANLTVAAHRCHCNVINVINKLQSRPCVVFGIYQSRPTVLCWIQQLGALYSSQSHSRTVVFGIWFWSPTRIVLVVQNSFLQFCVCNSSIISLCIFCFKICIPRSLATGVSRLEMWPRHPTSPFEHTFLLDAIAWFDHSSFRPCSKQSFRVSGSWASSSFRKFRGF